MGRVSIRGGWDGAALAAHAWGLGNAKLSWGTRPGHSPQQLPPDGQGRCVHIALEAHAARQILKDTKTEGKQPNMLKSVKTIPCARVTRCFGTLNRGKA